MRSRLLPAVLVGGLSVLLLAACSADGTGPRPSATPSASGNGHGAPHWSYEGATGPSRWGSLSSDYRQCSTGRQQSPVDLPADSPGRPLDLAVDLGTLAESTEDNGHTVQMSFEPGGTTTVDGRVYALKQMHHHVDSEHTVDGEDHDAEFHFVHADADGRLLVVGVLADEGAHNAAYEPFVAGAHRGGASGDADVASMLPTDLAHRSYVGSLTTPPCTEGVTWVVLTTPVHLGEDQLAALESTHDDNHRPVQPLHGREVLGG